MAARAPRARIRYQSRTRLWLSTSLNVRFRALSPRNRRPTWQRICRGFPWRSASSRWVRAVSLNIKKLSHPDGAWRLRSGDWRSLFFQTGEDFLVAAIGPRRDIYERLPRIRLARWAGGLRIVETEHRGSHLTRTRSAIPSCVKRDAPSRSRTMASVPFDDAMLCSIAGVDDEVLAFLRSLPSTVDAPGVIAQRLADTDLAFLLADLWERPQHHLDTFAAGAIPAVDQLAIEDQELRSRLVSPTSETELDRNRDRRPDPQAPRRLHRGVDGLPASVPARDRRCEFNGPARVRGGPGNGQDGGRSAPRAGSRPQRVEAPDKVLLTTFLQHAPEGVARAHGTDGSEAALERLDIVNIDSLARGSSRSTSGAARYCEASGRTLDSRVRC